MRLSADYPIDFGARYGTPRDAPERAKPKTGAVTARNGSEKR